VSLLVLRVSLLVLVWNLRFLSNNSILCGESSSSYQSPKIVALFFPSSSLIPLYPFIFPNFIEPQIGSPICRCWKLDPQIKVHHINHADVIVGCVVCHVGPTNVFGWTIGVSITWICLVFGGESKLITWLGISRFLGNEVVEPYPPIVFLASNGFIL